MRKLIALAVILTAASLNGCHLIGVTPIGEIVAAPANFEGKQVKLRGTVKDVTRVPLVNIKSYVLKDDSGEITILTDADLPKAGEKISVTAKVESLAIIRGESLGMTVTEIERR